MPLKLSFVPNGECIPNTKHNWGKYFFGQHTTQKREASCNGSLSFCMWAPLKAI